MSVHLDNYLYNNLNTLNKYIYLGINNITNFYNLSKTQSTFKKKVYILYNMIIIILNRILLES